MVTSPPRGRYNLRASNKAYGTRFPSLELQLIYIILSVWCWCSILGVLCSVLWSVSGMRSLIAASVSLDLMFVTALGHPVLADKLQAGSVATADVI